ncbi:MAG: efflux RND transporter periplasmic adaptor subunit [Bacteroidetes bacterium]|nr:MAG: efflux RND transporter periplasmic adaptor subunit [Bacteroidota bacterium]
MNITMKTAKKYATIAIAIAIVALVIFRLISNKKQLDSELKAMMEYSSVIPVEVISPVSIQAKQILEENGILRAEAEITILSETSGKVVSVSGSIGEPVSAGQTLVVVEKDVPESQYRLARISYEIAENDMVRFNNLASSDAITQQQLEAAKLNYQNALANYIAIKKQLENTVIQSPANGLISKRLVEAGAFITPSMPVFTILEQNRMVFAVKVTDTDMFRISKGQKAEIMLDALPGRTFYGNIRSIGVTADLSGRYEVEISISAQEAFLRGGMGGKAIFEIEMQDTGVVIPRKCIVGSIKDATVFVLSDNSVTSRKIKAMAINETEILITEGLSVNDKVVLSGQINLADGSKVRILNR